MAAFYHTEDFPSLTDAAKAAPKSRSRRGNQDSQYQAPISPQRSALSMYDSPDQKSTHPDESEELELRVRNMILKNGVPRSHPSSVSSGYASQVHPDDSSLAPSVQPPQKSFRNPVPLELLQGQHNRGFLHQGTHQGPFNQYAENSRRTPGRSGDLGLPPMRYDQPARLDEQCRYVEQLAAVEIPNTEMLPREKQEREDLRRCLENICRETIATHERESNPLFEPESVVLECFGSLKSGFATRNADMDLVLSSPQSKHDPASPESKIPRLLESIFLASGFGSQLLTRTRVPIIRGCQSPPPELLEALITNLVNFEAAFDSDSKTSDPVPPKKLGDYSDLELAQIYILAMNEGLFNETEARIVDTFIQELKVSKSDLSSERLATARSSLKALPDVLSRYQGPLIERLQIPRTGVGILWDLNFSNHLARHNTQLLRCYSLCDPRIRDMVLFIKAWTKRRGINCAFEGTLCSYGYVLMVLHYVVNIANPPLAPNLQLQLGPGRGGSPSTEKECEGLNVQFWRDEDAIRLAARRGQITYSKESLGSLLRGFFQYYAENTTRPGLRRPPFHWMKEALSLRTEGGILTKLEKGWTEAKIDTVQSSSILEAPMKIKQRYLLCIEDPFELHHNVARTVTHDGICAIRDEFRRAHRIIQNLGIIYNVTCNLFEEGKQLQLERKRTFFGPHPAVIADRQRQDSQRNERPPRRDNQNSHNSRDLAPRYNGQAHKQG